MAIMKHLPDRENRQMEESHREVKPTVEELPSKTEHALQHVGTRYICTRCHSGFQLGIPSLNTG